MKRNSIFMACLMLLTAVFTGSCAKEDEIASTAQEYITISVVKDGITKATTSGGTTALSSGDALGLYALDASGKVVAANIKFIYSGSSWSSTTPVPWSSSYKYYAYFPYQSSPTGGPTVGSTFSSTGADDVFASLISSWTPKTDQSSMDNFIASDLCAALGTASSSKNVSFVLKHKMGLVQGTGSATYRLTKGDAYTFTVPNKPTFSGNIPYSNNGTYYYIVKPNSATSLGGLSLTVEGGKSLTTAWTATKDFTLTLGDVIYSDGTISHQSDALITDKTPIGVVVYVSDDTNANNSKVLEGKTHGLVLYKSSLGGAPWGVYGTQEDTGNFPLVQSYSAAISDFGGINKTNILAAKYDGTTAVANWTDGDGNPQSTTYYPYQGPYIVKNFTGAKPSTYTQWFMASSGQWIEFLNQILSAYGGDLITSSKGVFSWTDNNESNPYVAITKLNEWCGKAGGSFGSSWNWTSSQCSAWGGVSVSVGSGYGVYVDYNYKFRGYTLRAFSAF